MGIGREGRVGEVVNLAARVLSLAEMLACLRVRSLRASVVEVRGRSSVGGREGLEETMFLRSFWVLACWVEMMSRNDLVAVMSGRESAIRGVIFVAIVSERIEVLKSRMSSSMRKAAA